MKTKVILFGAGRIGKLFCSNCEDDISILAIVDNDSGKWGKTFFGHEIMNPSSIVNYDFDKIIITVMDWDRREKKVITGFVEILKQLLGMEIPQSKLCLYSVYDTGGGRVKFMQKFSKIIHEMNIQGAVAECGVFRGGFAGCINRVLPDRKLYLFDTFEGFDPGDIDNERHLDPNSNVYKDLNKWATGGSAEASLMRCLYNESVVIKRGYVPETFQGLENEKFAFVNLDMDLFEPQLAAMRFFAPRMSQGGLILLHDYYHTSFISTKPAVEFFSKEYPITLLPVEDGLSIALIPHNNA